MSNCRHRQVCLFLYLAKRLERTVFGLLASKTLISDLYSTLGYLSWKKQWLWLPHYHLAQQSERFLTATPDTQKLIIITYVWDSQICCLFLFFFLHLLLLFYLKLAQWHTPWPAVAVSREKEARWMAAWAPFASHSLAASLMHFCNGGTRRMHPGILWTETQCRCWKSMGPMSGIQQSIKARHIFLRKITTPHFEDSFLALSPSSPPTGCEDSSPRRRQTHSTCSGSSVTVWPSLDVVPASLDDLLLESRVVCCRGDAQLFSLMWFKCQLPREWFSSWGHRGPRLPMPWQKKQKVKQMKHTR